MIVDKVIQMLSSGGIRAEAAFPGERISRITEPVAAVSLKKADLEDQIATVLVEVFGPQESGGYLCQKQALQVCAILEEEGGICSQGGCDYISKGHVFRVPVEATFRGAARANDLVSVPKFTVTTGELPLSYACGFSAEQSQKSTSTLLDGAPWDFTVEEFFPWGVEDTLSVEEPFDMNVACMGIVERYQNCMWTNRKRIAETLGIRQIRKGTAASRIHTSE